MIAVPAAMTMLVVVMGGAAQTAHAAIEEATVTSSTIATANPSQSVAAGDVTGDGIPDLATGETGMGTVRVMPGLGGSTWGAGTSYSMCPAGSVNDVTLADVTSDDQLDLITGCGGSDGGVVIRRGAGDGTFGTPNGIGVDDDVINVEVAHLNADTYPDLAFSTYTEGVQVALGSIVGGWSFSHAYGTFSTVANVKAADMDDDGDQDLVAGEFAVPGVLHVLANSGNGAFPTERTYAGQDRTFLLGVGDLDLDGLTDVVATHRDSDSYGVWMGIAGGRLGSASFTTTDNMPYSGDLAHLNGDRTLDMAIAYRDGANSTIKIYSGDGDGTFTERQSVDVADDSGSVTIVDANGDDVPDVMAADGATSFLTLLTGATTFPGPGASTRRATRIGRMSATLHARITPRNQSTTVRFRYGRSSFNRSSTSIVETGNGVRTVSIRISGLKRCRTYKFRVTATAAAGTKTGGIKRFRTLCD